MSIPEELKRLYRKQDYHLVGRHSAVKTCLWTRKSLRTSGGEYCYKQRFYGIPCHRCLQMTPALGRCLQSCVFCWRAMPTDLSLDWDQRRFSQDEVDDADSIVEGSLEAHREAISGFGGNLLIDRKIFAEANMPVHAAISLEGEPTLYPRIGELVDSFFTHGFKSVFIVTNGLRPDVLSNLSREPSQLYVSVCAPDEDAYRKTCRPLIKDGWRRLMETLELLHSFNCPTVLRHTLMPKLNMENPSGYAKLAIKANATYLEPKAAKSVGFARRRFPYSDMAWHRDVCEFSEVLSKESGYKIIDEHPSSSVVLLSKLDKPKKLY
ncbi:4-demethylwyosine synthase TYW1 [Candidatus Bathyarchaeota archaeon]|nr:4-demethylwyosine synthase TYW1 [Candidatus Bathyarchaeota archaeon]MBS7630576.1 4-demethylwyosine synthase TYW1 [Candidatus Bathyarchaeota archaeon]